MKVLGGVALRLKPLDLAVQPISIARQRRQPGRT
jgi:hypothetical protein